MTLTPTAPDATTPRLSPIQARVLATLMEKARTVPDSYPLTLHSLLAGCNQKTSRDPVLELDEAQVIEALEDLKATGLVRVNSGARAPRWEHNFQRRLALYEQSAVLLGLLMLRGPQTAAELRLNSERWYKFADPSSVEGFLEELQQRADDKGGALVVKLPRAAGAREQRWAHLLCGAPEAACTIEGNDVPAGGVNQRLERLEAELALLRETVQTLCTELGLSRPGQT